MTEIQRAQQESWQSRVAEWRRRISGREEDQRAELGRCRKGVEDDAEMVNIVDKCRSG